MPIAFGKSPLHSGLHRVDQVIDLADALESRLQGVGFTEVGLHRLKAIGVLEFRCVANKTSDLLMRTQPAE
jgi:hypothetical protein